MSNYSVVKTATDAYIKRNGRKEITGPILNNILNAIIDSLGKYYQFVGVATPVTNPGSPDQNVAYIASTEGTYANMGGFTLSSGELAVIKWDGEWVKETILVLPDVAEGNVFIADYGVTSLADVKNAFDDGKIVVVRHLDKTFFPAYIDSSSNDFTFFAFDEVGDIYYCTINSNIGWSPITNFSFVQWSSVVKVWPNIPNHYTIPTTKLVYDSIAERYLKPSGGIPSTDMDASVQTSLGKANTAVQPGDLAPVATSGDYNDLDNLPTIPAPQVQSDWDEANVDDPAYIKNKPTIPAAQVQSDWNEADNTNPAYIKNKPNFNPVPEISTDIPADRTSDDKTASPKAVYDFTAKYGVISQTQTWTQASDGGYDYAMSNLVWGAIPQANIDLYEAAGATFNAVTGYFELNGLEDISYEEMKAIYNDHISHTPGLNGRYEQSTIRTNLPEQWYGKTDPSPAIFGVAYSTGYMNGMFSFSNVEVGLLPPSDRSSIRYIKPTNLNNLVRTTERFKKLINPIDCTDRASIPYDVFFQAYSLEDVSLYKLKGNVSFDSCARLSVASILYMINNSQSNAFTITLHATAYARATADTDVQTALAAHTNVTLASA